MKTQHISKQSARLALPGLLGALLLAAPSVGLTSNWGASISETVLHDSNIFRYPDALGIEGDTVRVTAAQLGLDLPWSRQQFTTQAVLQDMRYSRLSRLDHEAYSLRGAWEGSTVEHVWAKLEARTQSDLAPFNPGNAPLLKVANTERVGQFAATVRLGAQTPLAGEAGWLHDSVHYSEAVYAFRNVTQDTYTLLARWRPGRLLEAHAGARLQQGERPQAHALGNGLFDPDVFQRRYLDAGLRWNSSQANWAQAALSLGRADHGQNAQNSAPATNVGSARLELHWEPTVRLQVNARLLRDVGSDLILLEGSTPASALSTLSARRTTDARLNLQWEAAPRWLVLGSAQVTQRGLSNLLQATTGAGSLEAPLATATDRAASVRLNLQWAPHVSTSVACGVGRDLRSVLQAGGISANPYSLTSPYRSTSVNCWLRWSAPRDARL